jgi:hypothetical protein
MRGRELQPRANRVRSSQPGLTIELELEIFDFLKAEGSV